MSSTFCYHFEDLQTNLFIRGANEHSHEEKCSANQNLAFLNVLDGRTGFFCLFNNLNVGKPLTRIHSILQSWQCAHRASAGWRPASVLVASGPFHPGLLYHRAPSVPWGWGHAAVLFLGTGFPSDNGGRRSGWADNIHSSRSLVASLTSCPETTAGTGL